MNVLLPLVVGVIVCVPLADSDPDHAPLAVQVLAFMVDHVSVTAWPAVMVVGCTDTITVGINGIVIPPPP